MKKFLNYLHAFVNLVIAFFLSLRFIWNIVNYSAIKRFHEHKPKLSNEEESILETLKNDGYALTHLDFFNDKILEEIQSFQENLKPMGSEVKEFLTYYLGGDYRDSRQYFNKLNPLLEFSLNERLAAIVNSYFNLLPKLCYLEINETRIQNSNNSSKSQKFHRDPGIDKCIKVFVYLNDVDKYSGPFMYVKYSHLKDALPIKSKRFGGGGIYPDEKNFQKIVNNDHVIPICGKAGTVIIADTTGLHCGGNSLKNSRKMATMVFYPPGDLKKSKIDCSIPDLEVSFPASSYLLSK